ncbi:MAG TPA: hypothetical protein VKX49_25205 [Bryobacteraceae bacterium]|nr:hypothetical protein [Bryobacteraceae bacterium]
MTSCLRERLAVGSCAVLGLAISTGYPMGMIVAAAMPYVCLMTTTKKGGFRAGFAYYLAALWPMFAGLRRYLGSSSTALTPLAVWILGAIALSIPWALAATPDRAQYLWRVPLAVAATVLPPLGIIGLASPLSGAGYLFPGTGWLGLATVALLPAILLAAEALAIRKRLVVSCCTIAFCAGLAIAPRLLGSSDREPPRGWVAVNTYFGDISEPLRDFTAAQFIEETAAKTPARVLIFPEAVVPRWSEATETFWQESLDRCRNQGQILVFGAGVPRPGQDNSAKLSDLQRYDFGAALSALKSMDTRTVTLPVLGLPGPEPTDNALLLLGAESGTFYQRVPVPIGMWKPFSRDSVPLRINAPGVLNVDHQRAAILICYEQMLTFPVLASMLQHPTVLVGTSNTFWVTGTNIPRYQANAVRGWAKLFRLPYLLAVNS